MVRGAYHRPEYFLPDVRRNLPVGRVRHRAWLSTRLRPRAAECAEAPIRCAPTSSREASLRFPELAGDKFEIETRRALDRRDPGAVLRRRQRVEQRTRVSITGSNHSTPARASRSSRCRWYRIGGGIALRQHGGSGRHRQPPLDRDVRRRRRRCCFRRRDTRRPGVYGHRLARVPGYTRRGGLYSLAWNDFKDADDDFSFHRFDAEIQQSIPLLKEHWVLAFRGLLRTTEVKDEQIIPYYLLPTLGGARLHRGYSDFRFQDRHVMLLSAEYRWIPSRVIDMALFVDTGKVAPERRDLDFDNLKTAYGIGFRIHGPNFTPLRLDVAHGDEGVPRPPDRRHCFLGVQHHASHTQHKATEHFCARRSARRRRGADDPSRPPR